MADDRTLRALEEEKKRALASLEEYQQSVKVARDIKDINANIAKVKEETKRLVTQGRELGGFERVFGALGALSPINSYMAGKEAQRAGKSNAEIARIQLGTYARDIKSSFVNLATGRESRTTERQLGTDALVKLGGLDPNKFSTKVMGAGVDIFTDPAVFTKPLKPLLMGMQAIGKIGLKYASKIPAIEKGAEKMAAQFDLFHGFNLGNRTEDFKTAFREAANTGKLDVFKQFGKQMPTGKYVPVTAGQSTSRMYAPTLAGQSAPITMLSQAQVAAAQAAQANAASRTWQNMSNLGWGQGPKSLSGYTFDPQITKILNEAFGEKTATSGIAGKLLKGYDGATTWMKSLLAYNPITQIRNVQDAMIKEFSEVRNPKQLWNTGKNFLESIKLNATKGKGNQGLWDEMTKYGITTNTGMGELSSVVKPGFIEKGFAKLDMPGAAKAVSYIRGIPGWIGTTLESTFARVPTVLREIKAGKTVADAAKAADKMHYNYSNAYLTSFEKNWMSRVLPFYKYEKGQFKYWPDALANKQGKYASIYHTKENTEPDSLKDRPDQKPKWFDMMSFGSTANFGSSVEDWSRSYTGDIKSWMMKVAPVGKWFTEALTDWSLFNEESISGNLKGKKYSFADKYTKGIVGYNEVTGQTENTWAKWGLESAFGILLDPYLKARNPNVPWSRTFSPTREYDVSAGAIANMASKEGGGSKGTGGVAGMIASPLLSAMGWLFGSTATAGSNVPTVPTETKPLPVKVISVQDKADAIMSSGRSDQMKLFQKNFAPALSEKDAWDKIGYTYQGNVQTEHNAYLQNTFITKKQMAEAMKYGGDYIKNWDEGFKYGLLAEIQNKKAQGQNAGLISEFVTVETAKNEAIKPRTNGEYFFTSKDKDYKVLGQFPWEIALNNAKKENAQAWGKIVTELKKTESDDLDEIKNLFDSQADALKKQQEGMAMEDEALFDMMFKANELARQKAAEKLTNQINKAYVDTFDDLVEGMQDGVEKIRMKQAVAIEQYKNTDDYRRLIKNDPDMAAQALENKKARYDQQIRDRQALEAKNLAEAMAMTYKNEAETVIKALESLFKRGGMSIEQYYKDAMASHMKVATGSLAALIDEFRTLIDTRAATALPISKPSPLDSSSGSGWTVDIEQIQGLTTPYTKQAMASYQKLILSEMAARGANLDETKVGEAIIAAQLPSGLVAKVKSTAKAIVKNVTDAVTTEVAKSADGVASLKEYNDVVGKLDPKASQEEQIKQFEAIQEVISKLMQDKVVDAVKGYEVFTKIGTIIQTLKQDVQATIDNVEKMRDELTAAIRSLDTRNTSLSKENREALVPKTIGDLFAIYASGKNPNFQMNKGNFYELEQEFGQKRKDLKLAQATERTNVIKSLAFDTEDSKLMGMGPAFGQDEFAGETPEEYFARTNAAIAKGLEESVKLKAESVDKLKKLNELSVNQAEQSAILEADLNKKKWELSLGIGMETAAKLLEVTTILYEQSGKKSREAFYAMKAISLAMAIVKGGESIMSAYAAGSLINPWVGAAYAAATAAMVGYQIGTIIATTISGPEGRAEGGEITGGSGSKDDVPIMAMGGEYVIQKSSVNKYGKGMLEAINRGLFDAGNTTFAMPDIPTGGSGRYADGGPVKGVNGPIDDPMKAGSNSMTIINVIDPSEMDRYLSSAQGQNAILNVLSSKSNTVRKVLR